MTNVQARLLAFPLVMIAGSLYSVVREEYSVLIGGGVFVGAAVFFVLECRKSFRS